jgi:hypothetical protein
MKVLIAFLTTALAVGVLLDAISPRLRADEIGIQSGFQSGSAVPVVSMVTVPSDQPVSPPIFPPSRRAIGQLAASEFVAPTGAGQRSAPQGDNASRWRRQWSISLAPLFASEALDAASSYGLREQNPLLAGSNGGFGMKAVGIKFGVVGALAGGEYFLVRKHPASAKFFTIVNWVTAGATSGLAIHNFRLH